MPEADVERVVGDRSHPHGVELLPDRQAADLVGERRAQRIGLADPAAVPGLGDRDRGARTDELQPLLEGAFAMEPGEEPAVETIQENQRFALVAIGRALPAAAPPLARIRDRVKADLVVRRASERARAIASAIVARINAGVPPAQAFAQAQVKLPAVQTLTATRREIARQPEGSPLRRALEDEAEYDVLETCAADGSCQLVCPVGIDTGKLVKELRTGGHSPGA